VLDEAALGEFIERKAHRSLFRLEARERYDVPAEREDFDRYLRGEPGPVWSRKQAWLDVLRADAARGLYSHRVHVVHSPLNDYLRFECEWAYTYNVEAGEDTRILDLAEVPRPPALIDEDFWLLDDHAAVRMHYDDDDRYLGGEIVLASLLPRYRAARDAAWSAGVPFTAYWSEHPQYWRTNWRAA
jgi:hypothetical protein